MTTTLGPPVTARAVLFGSSDAVRSVEESLREQGILGSIGAGVARVSADLHGAVLHELSAAVADLLRLDVIDLLVAAWRRHAALIAAAQRTAAEPGSSEVVELATHHISSTHRPYLDVVVDDVHLGRIHVELELSFTVVGLVATVRDGHLAGLQSGRCTAAATLMIEGFVIRRGETGFDLPLAIGFGGGVPLLPGHDDARGSGTGGL